MDTGCCKTSAERSLYVGPKCPPTYYIGNACSLLPHSFCLHSELSLLSLPKCRSLEGCQPGRSGRRHRGRATKTRKTCLGPRGRRAAAAAGGHHGQERWSAEGTVRRAGATALGGIDNTGRAAATAIYREAPQRRHNVAQNTDRNLSAADGRFVSLSQTTATQTW
jgi:hypothetical protein